MHSRIFTVRTLQTKTSHPLNFVGPGSIVITVIMTIRSGQVRMCGFGTYRKTSNISRTFIGNKIAKTGAAPTTASFST